MKYSENYLQEFFGNLTPSELDELAPAGFDAKAPRGALKRIEKSAVEKAGVRPAKRKRYFKPLMIAAAAVAAMTATLFTVNAASGGNLVRFFIGGKEVEGGYRDYVDHDGYRHVSFDAVIPIEAENFAVIFNVDEPDFEKAVRVLTEESNPDFFSNMRRYLDAREATFIERRALRDAGADESELPEPADAADFGLVPADNELCMWNMSETLEDGAKHDFGGALGGRFMTTGTGAGHPSNAGGSEHINRDNGTKSYRVEFEYFVGLD